MDLDKIFKAAITRGRYHAFICSRDNYKITLWVGVDPDGSAISSPDALNLSLNDYTHFGIQFSINYLPRLKDGEMKEIFGFDFSKFAYKKFHVHENMGDLIPKEYLVEMLKRLGIISSMPIDAGDGE